MEEVVALVVEEVVMATLCATAATGSLSLQIKILAWLHWTWELNTTLQDPHNCSKSASRPGHFARECPEGDGGNSGGGGGGVCYRCDR